MSLTISVSDINIDIILSFIIVLELTIDIAVAILSKLFFFGIIVVVCFISLWKVAAVPFVTRVFVSSFTIGVIANSLTSEVSLILLEFRVEFILSMATIRFNLMFLTKVRSPLLVAMVVFTLSTTF